MTAPHRPMKHRKLAIVIARAAFWLVSTPRAATETLEYRVIRKDGDVKIRDCPALVVARLGSRLERSA